MKDIYDFAEGIKTKEEFESFLLMLIEDLKKNGNDEDHWENIDLCDFLNALLRVLYDSDNKKISELTWNKLADLFLTAKIYE